MSLKILCETRLTKHKNAVEVDKANIIDDSEEHQCRN